MAKLIVFYSRADENYFGGSYRYIKVGNTEKVAKQIAKQTGAELFKIVQEEPYAAEYQTCIEQAKKDLQTHARPKLVSMPENLDEYDEIYLGYPNYWGDLPMAVYTFLEHYNWDKKTIHPFCTHEGSCLGATENKIRNVCEEANVTKGIAIRGSDADRAEKALEKWI
ncbi:MAG TPA: flavodoxin [Erysipelotrichaceae bacterium]|nr:flavodoxin [Erysipelotrichaceae bacterium]